MAGQSAKGLRRIINAWGYSISGLRACYQHEEAFRQELMLLLVALPLGLWLGSNGVERALLIGSLLLIPIVELLNSAVEAAIDRFGGEHHELSGRAKDIGSAAVMFSFIQAGLVWVLVLF